MNKQIDVERARLYFRYDPVTGDLIYRHVFGQSVQFNGRWAGKVAGGKPRLNGYISVSIKGVRFYSHRIIWALVTGNDPGNMTIDHIDGDRKNNLFQNLRLATRRQQSYNSPGRGEYKKGVSWHEGAGKYQAHIRVGGENRYLGIFGTEDAAAAAYNIVAAEVHGDFVCMR